MSLVKSEKALLCLVVPHLHMTIITSRNEVRSVKPDAEVQAINSCLMTDEGVIGISLFVSHCPNLNGFIQRCTSKHAWVFGIDGYLHDVMFMILI